MHQTQKKQWLFGLKAHIDVDARMGLTHIVSTTAANVHDITETTDRLYGTECYISADSGYRGAQKREELKGIKADWLTAEAPGKVNLFKKHPKKNKQPIKTEYIEASIRAKIAPPPSFRIIKCQFGFRKPNYRGLAKNDRKLAILFALGNVFRIDQMIRDTRG